MNSELSPSRIRVKMCLVTGTIITITQSDIIPFEPKNETKPGRKKNLKPKVYSVSINHNSNGNYKNNHTMVGFKKNGNT